MKYVHIILHQHTLKYDYIFAYMLLMTLVHRSFKIPINLIINVAFYKNFSTSSCLRIDEMVRVLNVAEKNDAARSIAELMSDGRFRRREGRSVYNKIYEYEYTVFNQRCTMVMTSVSGHLLNLEFSGSYKSWQACNPVALFDAPVKLFCPEDYQKIQETLEKEVKKCDHLILWTDCDREGENIAFEILEVCKKANSRIQVHRAKFSEITKQAIVRAIRNLVQPNGLINDAVNVRRELDLRIGAAFTRFQTLRLQKVFPEVLGNQLISYGSCQFPTLGFVVDRYKQVQAFIPEPFWKLKVTHKKEELMTEFSWKRNRLFDHTACLVLYQICLENSTATVVDIKSRPKSKWRPQPLDTVELEKMASRKLHINAKQALNIAEKLYTKGFISYPRTETTIFPKELNLVQLVELQTGDPHWGAFAGRVLQDGPNPRQGTKTDNAHPPIHPIKYVDNLQGDEKKVYDFVVRRFLACLSKDAQGQETVIEIDVNSERFAASGLMIIARNYLDVYPYEKWNAKEVGEYRQGEVFQPSSIEMTESETSAPDLLTEADLIALMEKHGIGTDATHSEHIETIKSRLYVGVNENGRFVPGELGMGLVEGYDLMGFQMSKPHLRAELEADLKRICEGTKDPQVVLREQVTKYKEVFVESVRQAMKIDEALSSYFQTAPGQVAEETYSDLPAPVMKCPKCNSGDVVMRSKRDTRGFFLSCMSFPQCNAAIWFPDFVEEAIVTDEVCDLCHPGPVKKLKFKVKPRSLMPFFDDEFVACIGGCDRDIMETMNIRPIAASQNTSNSVVSSSLPLNGSISRQSSSDSGYGSSHSRPVNRNMFSSVNQSNNNSSTRQRPSQTTNSFNRSSSLTTFSGPSTNPGSSNSSSRGNKFSAGDNEIVCNCGSPAVLLTVRKEGQNKGRRFYKCADNAGSQCNFFLWEDDSSANSGTATNYSGSMAVSSNSTSNNRPSAPSSNGAVPSCNCGSQAKLLTVQKDGPNKGRKFYGCVKGREESCGFFQWADDVSSDENHSANNSRGSRSWPNTSRRRPHSASDGEQPAKRKCGLCNETGHNRRNCPLN